ncbi:hypothetical protein BSFP_005330 [Burkholderia stabilis]|uniref:Uncharacterized protein n=1 Tax=Burkholderia stabilis TaxID=95485 RepID=A0A1Y1BCN7_9BURK|nr:hypothetical protein BSFP_005330 [Burkholderia stabilis]
MLYRRIVMTVRPAGPARPPGKVWPTGLPAGRRCATRAAISPVKRR